VHSLHHYLIYITATTVATSQTGRAAAALDLDVQQPLEPPWHDAQLHLIRNKHMPLAVDGASRTTAIELGHTLLEAE
jgi:hypothetical protein